MWHGRHGKRAVGLPLVGMQRVPPPSRSGARDPFTDDVSMRVITGVGLAHYVGVADVELWVSDVLAG